MAQAQSTESVNYQAIAFGLVAGLALGLRLFPVATLPVPEEATTSDLPTLLDFYIRIDPLETLRSSSKGFSPLLRLSPPRPAGL